MNPLFLSGYGVKIKIENIRSSSNLTVTDGRENFKEATEHSFRPRRIPYDSIIIDGHSGYISLQALHWLSRSKIPVFILNYDGSLISSILPPMPVKADLRVAQIDSYRDPRKCRRRKQCENYAGECSEPSPVRKEGQSATTLTRFRRHPCPWLQSTG